MERDNFGSKLGVILAAAGSAVGLGNVWRFPYMTGQNGGAVFILIYFVCILFLGIPCIMNEFIIGRRAHSNTARAYSMLSNGSPWKLVGYLGVLTAFLISGYYVVVSGWCLQYIYASFTGHLVGNSDYVRQYFVAFSSDAVKPLLWVVLFILFTHVVIVRGVRKGIERASKTMMPALFILLLVIVVCSCLLPDADKGIAYLFHPDFSKLNADVFLGALGQSFYSLSIAMGCLCTYASYFSKQTHLMRSAVQIGVIDSVVAILAGLMIFPAAFSVGVNPDSGPSLLFITLPNVFQEAFGSLPVVAYIVSVMFYALLALAALTSTISMHEIGTAFFYEELHITRKKGASIETILAVFIGILCSLSCGAVKINVFGVDFLSACDYFTSNILMPISALSTSLFVGWYIQKKTVHDEFTNWGNANAKVFGLWLFAVRFVCPVCIVVIFLRQMGIL